MRPSSLLRDVPLNFDGFPSAPLTLVNCPITYVALLTFGDSRHISQSTIEFRSNFASGTHTFSAPNHGMTQSLLLANIPRNLWIISRNGLVHADGVEFYQWKYCYSHTSRSWRWLPRCSQTPLLIAHHETGVELVISFQECPPEPRTEDRVMDRATYFGSGYLY